MIKLYTRLSVHVYACVCLDRNVNVKEVPVLAWTDSACMCHKCILFILVWQWEMHMYVYVSMSLYTFMGYVYV